MNTPETNPATSDYKPAKGSRKLSARALGVLVYLHATGAQISAESLSKVFKEGEKAMRPVLKELKAQGFISSSLERIGNRIMTVNRLVDASLWPPETGGLIQQRQQNSNLILNTYSDISKKEYFRDRKDEQMFEQEEDFAPMYLEPEERQEMARKAREKKSQEHRARRDEQISARIKELKSRQPKDWTTDDGSHHFAERVALMWHVEPWTSVRTRFKAAYGRARRDYGTTGDIELKMMDRFFDGLDHKKHITNPEVIWKVFIRDYGALLTAVERSTVTPEDLAKAEEILKRQWEKY